MDRVREMLTELIGSIDSADSESVAWLVLLTAAMKILGRERARVQDGPEWVSAEEFIKSESLSPRDIRRLYRRWRTLPFCRPCAMGGRGFEVNRRTFKAQGGRFGGAGASVRF